MQADAYAGFNRLYEADRKPGPITAAMCSAHARRKLSSDRCPAWFGFSVRNGSDSALQCRQPERRRQHIRVPFSDRSPRCPQIYK